MLNPESGYSADRYTSLLGDSMARVTSLKKSKDMGGGFLRNSLHDGGGKRTGVVWLYLSPSDGYIPRGISSHNVSHDLNSKS